MADLEAEPETVVVGGRVDRLRHWQLAESQVEPETVDEAETLTARSCKNDKRDFFYCARNPRIRDAIISSKKIFALYFVSISDIARKGFRTWLFTPQPGNSRY